MKSPTLLILNVAVLIGTCVWAYNEPGYEPVIGIIGALAGLVALYVDSNNTGAIKQKQKGGRNSNNNQAGGDINISY